MSRSRNISIGMFLVAVAAGVFPVPVSGQTPAEIEALATRTAERIAKSGKRNILIASLQDCQLDIQICASFETSVRARIETDVSGVQFVQRDSVIRILESRGAIAFDANQLGALLGVAGEAGAEILLADTLEWKRDGYELVSEVYDTSRRKNLDQFRLKIARPAPNSAGEAMVITDPDSGASVIVMRGKPSGAALAQYPTCQKCPNPSYPRDARAHKVQGTVVLMATVTEQGVAEHIVVISGLADGLSDRAVETIRSWRFKPAIGNDGKPFATRVPIEVTFRLI